MIDPETVFADTNAKRRRVHVPVVKSAGWLSGRHGGRRLVLERFGKQWSTSFGTNWTEEGFLSDAQGDPRWFIETVGARAAAYLGFEVFGPRRMTVPDSEEFIGGIRKINLRLRKAGAEQIGLGFYRSSGDPGPTAYNRAFARAISIPIGAKGSHFLHDISFHSGGIFIPNYVLEYASAYSEYISSFAEFIVEKHGRDRDRGEAARQYAFRLNLARSQEIDRGTACIAPGVVDYRNTGRAWHGHPDVSVDAMILRLVGGALPFGPVYSPRRGLLRSIGRHLHACKSPFRQARALLQVCNRALPLAIVAANLDEFTAAYCRTPGLAFDPRRPFVLAVHRVLADVTKKRGAVRNAALELGRKLPRSMRDARYTT